MPYPTHPTTTHVIQICADCHVVFLGAYTAVFCQECAAKARPLRRCHPIHPSRWNVVDVAHFHPGGTAAQVWARIEREARR